VTPATIEFDVSADTLADRDLGADDIVLHRYDDDVGEWTELDTEVLDESDGEVTYESTTPGFSVFAVGERSISETPASIDESGESNESTETVDETPGFGLVTALVALLAVALVVGRIGRIGRSE